MIIPPKYRYSAPSLLMLILTLTGTGCSGDKGTGQAEGPIPVAIVVEDGKYNLLRNNEPYYIKGAGGQTHLSKVVAAGGNSIRLWSTIDENQESGLTVEEILNQADSLGLTVTLGLWVKHPRHDRSFYDDTLLVRKQLETFREDVRRYMHHPSLLMWAVGNEVHLHSEELKVWDAVNEIAAMIKSEDPHHLVTTITAGISPSLIASIQDRVPEIDLIGVNMYDNDLSYLPARIRECGWNKAYFIGEYGPEGPWKVKRTEWGARIEPPPDVKMNAYINAYKAFRADSSHCLGSYAFKWGWKWEKTYAWFNMFTHNGKESATIDALEYAWTGQWPDNRSPVAGEITIDGVAMGNAARFSPGKTYPVMGMAADPEGDEIEIEWRLYPEGTSKASGGDPEEPEIPVVGLLEDPNNTETFVTMPEKEGAYRLYLLAWDKNQRVSISNYPFLITGDH